MAEGYLDDQFNVTPYFLNLEASEKATVSFHFAQALTHFFAQQYMNMQYLVHVLGADATYHDANQPAYIPKGAGPDKPRSRPDFIGRCYRGDFHVFETKGRSGNSNLSNTLVQGALKQASKIATVNGMPPETRVAACFRFHETGIDSRIKDPDEGFEAYDLNFDEQKAIKKYYSFFLDEPMKRFRTREGETVLASKIDDHNYYAINEQVFSEVSRLENIKPKTFVERVAKLRSNSGTGNYENTGLDGIGLFEHKILQVL